LKPGGVSWITRAGKPCTCKQPAALVPPAALVCVRPLLPHCSARSFRDAKGGVQVAVSAMLANKLGLSISSVSVLVETC
jgi:hypothetical protein